MSCRNAHTHPLMFVPTLIRAHPHTHTHTLSIWQPGSDRMGESSALHDGLVQVYFFSFLLNICPGHANIDAKTQHMLSFSGLRGVVAFACATLWPDVDEHRKTFVTTIWWYMHCSKVH